MKSTAQRLAALLLPAFLSVACGSPPTEQLDAAQEALDNSGLARDCAPEEFRAAERLLADAREASAQGDYDRARLLAESAREQAERARLMAQANADDCEAINPPDAGNGDDNGDLEVVDTDHEFNAVYFGYDAAALDMRARQTIERHARFLSGNDFRVIIEGHCDHNGTDQYNLALGEARARSVAQYMVSLGIQPQRIQTISYGEFRPASASDLSLNRRAEFRVRR